MHITIIDIDVHIHSIVGIGHIISLRYVLWKEMGFKYTIASVEHECYVTHILNVEELARIKSGHSCDSISKKEQLIGDLGQRERKQED